jgi:catechol O-methyltransferase
MLDGTSSLLAHRLQDAILVLLSLAFLPLDTFVLFISCLLPFVFQDNVAATRKRIREKTDFRPRTILVTGVGMTKGLALARLFYQAGHDVIGADFEPGGALVCGRVSRSLKTFHRLQRPDARNGPALYIDGLLNIVRQEAVDLWVSCSGVASAVEDGMAKEVLEARTSCKGIQFNVDTTQTLHEKHSFIQHTRDIGLNTPETHVITSRAAVEKRLQTAPSGRKYIMKTIGMDDAVRADMTLLPKSNTAETSKHIARLNISEKSPWILQQFIKGDEYCTHALVVKGEVKAFVACPSAELLMHYEALPPDSSLSRAMLDFTTAYARAEGADFTGHLSFDFMVEGQIPLDPKEVVLYPIECNPRAHTAVALFNGTTAMVDGYLSALASSKEEKKTNIVRPTRTDKYYWVGHDLVCLVLLPTLSLFTATSDISNLVDNYRTFAAHLLTWRDGTYEIWDPLPWWWLYHVYWPSRFLNCLITGKKWSRLNVSTTKMFEC